MSGFLRQATAAQVRALGPFVSDSDFKTVQTGLTIANTDIKLVMNGAASANKNSGGGTHRVNGAYGVTWDATDTAALGEMQVTVNVAGAMVVFTTYMVLPAQVYDSLFLGTDYLHINPYAIKWNTTDNPGDVTAYKVDDSTVSSQVTYDSDTPGDIIVGAG